MKHEIPASWKGPSPNLFDLALPPIYLHVYIYKPPVFKDVTWPSPILTHISPLTCCSISTLDFHPALYLDFRIIYLYWGLRLQSVLPPSWVSNGRNGGGDHTAIDFCWVVFKNPQLGRWRGELWRRHLGLHLPLLDAGRQKNREGCWFRERGGGVRAAFCSEW